MTTDPTSLGSPRAPGFGLGMAGWRSPLAYAVAGAASGILAKVADELPVDGIGAVGSSPTIWILVLAIIARLAPSPASAAVRATVFFVAMCVAYYAWTALVLDYPGSGPLLVAWLGLAVTVVPATAALLRWARDRSDLVAAVIVAVVAGVVATDPSLVQAWYVATGELPPTFPVSPIETLLTVATVTVIILWVPARNTTRLWAAVLLIPATVVAGWLVDLAAGGLIPG